MNYIPIQKTLKTTSNSKKGWRCKPTFFFLILLLNLIPFTAKSEEPSKIKEDKGWYFLPAFSYDSDFGLGLGAYAKYAHESPKFHPYKNYFSTAILLTTKSKKELSIWKQEIDFFTHRDRLVLHFYYEENKVPYFGIGELFEKDYEEDFNFRYSQALIEYYLRIKDPHWLYTEIELIHFQLKDDPHLLLAEWELKKFHLSPLNLNLLFGYVMDSRDDSSNPHEGIYLKIAGGPSLAFPKKGYFLKFESSLFYPLFKKLIFAQNFKAHRNSKPFHFRKMAYLGGPLTFRGLSFARFRGNQSFASLSEARIYIHKFDISGTSLNCMTVLFSDNGAISEDYSKHILSHTVGLGLRFIINKGLIVRTDYGSSISHKDSSFALIVDHIF